MEDGGCPGFYDPVTKLAPRISISTFEKMTPGNLKRMTASQKEMVGCDTCIDGRAMHSALNNCRRDRLRSLNTFASDCRLEGDIETAIRVEEVRDEMAAAAFKCLGVGQELKDSTELNLETMRDAMAEMTCKPIGPTDLFHCSCALKRCRQGCRRLKKTPGENVF